MYKSITVSDIPQQKLRRAMRTGVLTLTAGELSGNSKTIHVHPETHSKLQKATRAGKGSRVYLTPHEIDYSSQHVGSLWSWLKGAARDTAKFVKDSWSDIKPYLSQGLDAAVAPLSQMAGQYAPAVVMGRQALRGLADVGVA